MKLLFILGGCAIHMHQANENFQEIFQKFLKGFRILKKNWENFREKKFPEKNSPKKI